MKAIGPLRTPLSQAKTGPRRRYGFAMQLAPAGQLALLNAPVLRARLTAERREIVCLVAERLISGGLSQNHAAVLLGMAPSRLFNLRRAYNEGGIDALTPRPGRKRKPRKASAIDSPCRLEIIIPV